MTIRPTYEELEQRVKELEKEAGKRKKEGEELRKYQFMVESAHDAIFFKDIGNRYLSVNNKTLEAFGLSREDVIGKNDYELMPDQKEAKKNVDNDQIVFKSGKPTEVLKHMTGVGGKEYWFQAIKVPQFDNDGKVIGLVGIARDITKRKRAEEALRESEERYKSLFFNNHSVMLLIDPESANIVDANPAAISFYGWSHEELTRKKITNINTFTERQVFQEIKRARMEQRRIFYFKHVLASGKIRDVEVYSGPIKVHGRELLYSIIHDITKRKQAELSSIEKGKDLENKTHELEELNAALKVLLKHRDEDKKDFEEKIVASVKKLVFPYIEKLYNSQLNDRQMVCLNIIKSNLVDIIAPFLHQLSSKYSDLTPSEIQVAGLVRDGKTTKEIADLFNSSTGTIDFHRNNLRKKLGLVNTKTNLRSFLLSLT